MEPKFEGGAHKSVSEAKAILRHDERENETYSNLDIDKSLSSDNVTIWGGTYEEQCKRLDRILSECPNFSANKTQQVVMQSICVYLPEELKEVWRSGDRDKVVEACQGALQTVADIFGEENIVGASLHVDEVHEYRHASTGEAEESLFHMHVNFVPRLQKDKTEKFTRTKYTRNKDDNGKYIPKKDEDGNIVKVQEERVAKKGELSKKNVVDKWHIKATNDKLNEYFNGLGYVFNTGRYRDTGYKDISDLKAVSDEISKTIEEYKMKEISPLLSERARIVGEISALKGEISELREAKRSLEREKDTLELDAEDLKRTIKTKRSEVKDLKIRLDEIERNITKLQEEDTPPENLVEWLKRRYPSVLDEYEISHDIRVESAQVRSTEVKALREELDGVEIDDKGLNFGVNPWE